MSTNKVNFERIPDEAKTVRSLGSLLFDKTKELGPLAIIDFRRTKKYLPLVRDFIASLYCHSTLDVLASDISFNAYGTSIRKLLKYCELEIVPDSFRMKDIDFEFLMKYRAYLKISLLNRKNGSLRRYYSNIKLLLMAGQKLNLCHIDLVPPRNFNFIDDGDVTQAYTSEESLDFEYACRSHIREILERLKKGAELLAVGSNPRCFVNKRDEKTGRLISSGVIKSEKPWNQLKNLIWYVINIMDGKYLNQSSLKTGNHSSFSNSVNGSWGGIYRRSDVYSHIYPLMEDLIPFIILLAKKTGLNESSIIELKRDCLRKILGTYYLIYTKPRGGLNIYKKAIDDDDGQFSVISLIRTLLKITESLLPQAENCNNLFIGLTIQGHGCGNVKPPDRTYIKAQMNRIGGWCEQRVLKDEHGRTLQVSLRRWRVTYLTNRYKNTGQLGKVRRDAAHAKSSTTVVYVNNESTKHLHEQAIEGGIRSAFSSVRPTVLNNENLKIAANVLGTDEKTTAKIIKGEQDVLFAACKDFFNRPGGVANSPCDKLGGCFGCSNSIITRHVLPRVILLRNFIIAQKSELNYYDWNRKFGEICRIITEDVLPKFTSNIIEEAERQALNNVLYIPFSMKPY